MFEAITHVVLYCFTSPVIIQWARIAGGAILIKVITQVESLSVSRRSYVRVTTGEVLWQASAQSWPI